MTDAYIFDAVRTPRGKGKKSGSLHEITALSLLTQQLEAIRERNDLDTSKVDDVIMGCVSPVAGQGADIARTAAITAGYSQNAAGVTINRFCASGLEAVNMAAAKVMSGMSDMVIGGGIESMSRVPMGAAGGAGGLPTALAELPVTTTLLLRVIQGVAVEHGCFSEEIRNRSYIGSTQMRDVLYGKLLRGFH